MLMGDPEWELGFWANPDMDRGLWDWLEEKVV